MSEIRPPGQGQQAGELGGAGAAKGPGGPGAGFNLQAAGAASGYPPAVNAALLANLKDQITKWEDPQTKQYFKMTRKEVTAPNLPKGKSEFNVEVAIYKQNPAKGHAKPEHEYTFFVKKDQGSMADKFTVYVGGPGHRRAVTNLDTTTVTHIPNNLDKLKAQDPKLYKKFMTMWQKSLAVQICKDLRKNEKKRKKIMHGNI